MCVEYKRKKKQNNMINKKNGKINYINTMKLRRQLLLNKSFKIILG
jgi:hypothetical protein